MQFHSCNFALPRSVKSVRQKKKTALHCSPHLDLLDLINIPPSSGTINLDLEEAHYNVIVQMFHINIV